MGTSVRSPTAVDQMMAVRVRVLRGESSCCRHRSWRRARMHSRLFHPSPRAAARICRPLCAPSNLIDLDHREPTRELREARAYVFSRSAQAPHAHASRLTSPADGDRLYVRCQPRA